MRTLIVFVCLCLLNAIASAQPLGGVIVASSHSGQFTARATRQKLDPAHTPQSYKVPLAGTWAFMVNSSPLAGMSETPEWDPALLVVSCDRIKELLLVELGLSDQWKGHVDIVLNSALSEDDEPEITAIWGPTKWNYKLEIPRRIKTATLTRCLVNVLLLEIANRKSTGDTAEIPLWLVDGLTAYLQAFNLPTFVVEPHTQIVGNRVKLAGLDPIRERMSHGTPLTFEELCWPDADKLTGDAREQFRDCAELLVTELLKFPDGKNSLAALLDNLPHHRNWQIAFLQAFQPHFHSLLDVEKWWGLACIAFLGHDRMQAWSPAECGQRLQDTVDVSVEIHLTPDRLPTPAKVTLQEVISGWEPDRELPVLDNVIQSLGALRMRMAREWIPLVDKYKGTLQVYLRDRQAMRSAISDPRVANRLNLLKSSTCQQLNRLDQQLAAQREKVAKESAIQTTPEQTVQAQR